MGESKFESLRMGNSKITLVVSEKKKILVIGRSKKNIREKDVINYLESIKKRSIREYKEILDNWNGNLTSFDDVDKIIDIKNDARNWFGFEISKATSKTALSQF
ncbi:MAG: hypothetical protein ACTSVE_04515 [Candidatus Helarchaeota archaeon]